MDSESSKQINVYFFGDSLTKGIGAQPIKDKRWTKVLCDDKKWIEHNYGGDGAVLEDTKPLNPWRVKSGYERIIDIPKYDETKDKYIFWTYGTNDAGFNLPGYNIELFKKQYKKCLEATLKQDWPTDKIIVLYGWYFEEPQCWEIYKGVGGVTTLSNHTRYFSFLKVTREVAKEVGVKTIYLYDFMKDKDIKEKIMTKDHLHPNNLGYKYIAKFIGASLTYSKYII